MGYQPYSFERRSGPSPLLLSILALAFAVLGAIIGGLVTCAPAYHAGQKRKATENAIEFARELGIENPTAACSDRDSDGDGYVSCTLRGANLDGFQSIECAGGLSLGSGCRQRYDVNLRR